MQKFFAIVSSEYFWMDIYGIIELSVTIMPMSKPSTAKGYIIHPCCPGRGFSPDNEISEMYKQWYCC